MALKEQLSDIKSDNATLVKSRQDFLKRLEQCVDLKESDLLSKFVLILYENKAKIRQQLEEISRYKPAAECGRDREDVERMEGIEEPSTLKGGGDSGAESDDIGGYRTPSPKPKKFSAKLSSFNTAAARRKPLPSSLLAEDIDNLHTSPPVRRRRKEAGKKVSGQPDIPQSLPHASEVKVRASSSSQERRNAL